MRHDLMHAGRFRSHQGQTEHGFARKVRINPVGSVEHFYIRGYKGAKSADRRGGFVQIASAVWISINSMPASI